MTTVASTQLETVYGLHDRVSIVTGAGSGIGKAIARLFSTVGARVIVADINADAAQAVADELNASRPGKAIALTCDISSEASVIALFDAATRSFGNLNVLVNNAGIYPKTSFLETSVEKWDRVQSVNLRGTFLCMREGIKRMQAGGKGGSIVNISSVGSRHTVIRDNGDYGASKAGVNSLTTTAAYEFADDQIRVNAVMPGGVGTEGAMRSVSDKPPTGPITQPGRVLLGRIATPEEIAQAVLFFASPASSYITGQLLAVDGGFLIS
jgi:NAD(P)-dependent dehydrogenase (short-subunit alcohol dehydrogenase family)